MDANIKPINYELVFEPNLKTFKFSGKERLKFLVKKPTNKIVLNAADLKINACYISYKNKEVKLKKVEVDEKKRSLQSIFQKELLARQSL